jgi:Tfp pilus assembly protein PilF
VAASAPIYAETEYPKTFGWSGLQSIRNGDLKLVRGVTSELFDLRRDPAETSNVINDQRRQYVELSRRMDDIGKTAVAASGAVVDEETRSKLASLGYIAPTAAKGSGRDPREMASLFRRYDVAQRTNAIPALEQLVHEDPQNPVFRSTLARAYKQSGAIDHAVIFYREAVALAPADPDAWYNLATTLQEAGHAAEAKKVIDEAVRLDPKRPDAHNVRGVALIESGDHAGAAEEFRQAIALDPRNARGYNNLGNVLRMKGRVADAEAAYRQALEITPNYADALNGLGVIAIQQGDARQAIDRFDSALAIAPDFYEAQLNRAIALQILGDQVGAADELKRLLRRLPAGRLYDGQRNAAKTLLGRLPHAQ